MQGIGRGLLWFSVEQLNCGFIRVCEAVAILVFAPYPQQQKPDARRYGTARLLTRALTGVSIDCNRLFAC